MVDCEHSLKLVDDKLKGQILTEYYVCRNCKRKIVMRWFLIAVMEFNENGDLQKMRNMAKKGI